MSDRAVAADCAADQRARLIALDVLANERDMAQDELDSATEQLRLSVRAAHREGVPKVDIARCAHISRPTLDKWLEG